MGAMGGGTRDARHASVRHSAQGSHLKAGRCARLFRTQTKGSFAPEPSPPTGGDTRPSVSVNPPGTSVAVGRHDLLVLPVGQHALRVPVERDPR